MTKALRATALALTARALVATSVPQEPPSYTTGSLVPGPTALAVETTCGPAGTVTASVDPESCEVTLEGAAAVGLPSSGRLDGASLTLRDGYASRHCQCDERASGEWTARCYDEHEPGALGCGGGDLPACSGTLRLATP